MAANGVEVHASDKFKPLYNLPEGTNVVVLIGGRGGMKTYEVSKWAAFSATIKRHRCAVLRDEKSSIRQSILNEILLRYDTANESGRLDQYYEKTEAGIKDKKTGNQFVFTKGFKASSNQKTATLKSISDVDIAIIEEAEDIRDEDKFNTFADSIRKSNSLIVILLNTPDLNHWIVRRYFNTEPYKDAAGAPIDGYFKIIPKQIPGFFCIQTGYKDNPYLPAHIVSNYENYGNPLSHLYNQHYYLTAILGLTSTGKKGQILTKVKPIKLQEYLNLPFKEVYGQDFGTASPAGLVGCKFDRNTCYARQINYEPMPVLELGKMYCRLKFNERDKIIADSAEPDTIEKLSKGWKKSELPTDTIEKYPALLRGFFIEACGTKDIAGGISSMQSMTLFAVEESKDLWNEIYNYIYAVDKNQMPTDEPAEGNDHLIDPWRYVVAAYKGKKDVRINPAMVFR